jgi:hypothetical protein
MAWMQKVAKKIEKSGHKGIFRRAAERAGMSTSAFAAKHAGDSGTLGKRARLAKAFMSAKH